MIVHKNINFDKLENFDEFVGKVKKLKDQKRTFTISGNFDLKNNNTHMSIAWSSKEEV